MYKRQANDKLKEFIIKGFVLDDQRLKDPVRGNDYFDELTRRIQDIRTSERRFYQKITDIYATSVDYSKDDPLTQQFYATVQNKEMCIRDRFTTVLKKDRYLESIQAHLLGLPSYRRFPTDEEFRRDIRTRDLYNFRNRSYWLRRLENHGRKERASVDEYTIEHILPQNPNLSGAWKKALGAEWERIQETWLHTLGN